MSDAPLALLVVAAGRGSRMGMDTPKQHLPLAQGTVLTHTLAALTCFSQSLIRPCFQVLVLAEHDSQATALRQRYPDWCQVLGGQERWQSVLAGLAHIRSQQPDAWVMVHDAARPFVAAVDMQRLWQSCRTLGEGGLLATPVVDTIKRQGSSVTTLDRQFLWAAQTPQCFPVAKLWSALTHAQQQGWSVTDEASAMERAGEPVHLIAGDAANFKITTPADLAYAAWLLEKQ